MLIWRIFLAFMAAYIVAAVVLFAFWMGSAHPAEVSQISSSFGWMDKLELTDL